MSTAVVGLTQLLERRLREIREESEQLERALAEFNGSRKPRNRGRRLRKGSSRSSTVRARPGERAEQFVELVTKQPDLRGSEIARTLGMKPSQVYQLAARLEKQGRIEKTKAGYRSRA